MSDITAAGLEALRAADSPGALRAAIADNVTFGANGLLPAIVQEAHTREVLMLAWMDAEALARTVETRRGTYWSRSRQEYWVKGETSGHTQQVTAVSVDCDADTVLLQVEQAGPACHTGTATCFTERRIDEDHHV